MSAIRTPNTLPAPVAPSPPTETGAEVSARAFARDLPDLLQSHAGQWVAYANGERRGFAARQTPLYVALVEQGYAEDEIVVRFVAPDEGGPVECSPR
jgi:hypothetical protein